MTKVWLKRVAMVLALGLLALSFVNASWLAPPPPGRVKLLADRGAHQQVAVSRDALCASTRIEPPVHDYLENTLSALGAAARLGAQMIAVDVTPTADGRFVLFSDSTLDCITDGTGETSARTLAELKALDAGHGYTADGGKTFPFRGKSVGAIMALEEALQWFPEKPLLFNLTSSDPLDAERLANALKVAGRDVEKIGDGFTGDPAAVARIGTLFPKAWANSTERALACTDGYLKTGWFGIVPEACRNGTLIVRLDFQWAFPGWPNRLMARMDSVGARVIVVESLDDGGLVGLDLPEQLGEIPASYTGHVWVKDIWTVGPALHPALNKRNPREEAELAAVLAARRKARE